MVSFHELQELFLLCHNDGILNDEELLLLYEEYQSNNPNFLWNDFSRLDLHDMNEAECLAEFRVRKCDLPLLAEVLQIPDSFTCYQRTISSGMEALCILLRRLSYPCRYSDMLPRFGMPVPVLSMVCNQVIDYIYDLHSHRLTQWNHQLLSQNALQVYSDAVAAKGAALQNCFGFVDGTVRPICRPGEHQRIVYNGHKRVHALKFQCVALPNGLIGQMYGPVGKITSFTVLI
ncbi:MAG: hypothetical protein DSY43_04245 [Gammaproteobacteria bacterium]|nr:MAG: hypothetical protein DSY43_04245 [Gammaproteobacteria bacterium]